MKIISALLGEERLSTQELLESILQAIGNGENELCIDAAGQQDIGGPLWHPTGSPLKLIVNNPGQRVGAMCLEGTEILVEGSAPADVGWLNAGGRIILKGDAGDTAGHCAASGTIYIGGRAGARSGSLMKHDPLYSASELWVLKSCGSFSFEFMSGGVAVICGHDSEGLKSVLGDRSCVGMVGGRIYCRGPLDGISSRDVKVSGLTIEDIDYLTSKMEDFLGAVGRSELKGELTNWEEWSTLEPLSYEERTRKIDTDVRSFRASRWVSGGIFDGVYEDDLAVVPLVAKGDFRRKVPLWSEKVFVRPENSARQAGASCNDCRICMKTCPTKAIIRVAAPGEAYHYAAKAEVCIGCGICAGVCPAGTWNMRENTEKIHQGPRHCQVAVPAMESGKRAGACP